MRLLLVHQPLFAYSPETRNNPFMAFLSDFIGLSLDYARFLILCGNGARKIKNLHLSKVFSAEGI
jgi:hypothetical protein